MYYKCVTNMSFSGKKFKKTGGSNLDDFFKASCVPEDVKKVLMSCAPTWCYTMVDPQTLRLEVQTGATQCIRTFKLGVEHELSRVDGSQVYMTFTLEGDNVVNQKIRKPNGTIAHFRREFHDRRAVMTITTEGEESRKAHVFYDVVD